MTLGDITNTQTSLFFIYIHLHLLYFHLLRITLFYNTMPQWLTSSVITFTFRGGPYRTVDSQAHTRLPLLRLLRHSQQPTPTRQLLCTRQANSHTAAATHTGITPYSALSFLSPCAQDITTIPDTIHSMLYIPYLYPSLPSSHL